MSLTAKQEAFCVAYLERPNASDAYRQTYSAERMAPTTINRAAKELLDNPKIAARLAELRKPAIEAAQMTVEQHLADLRRIRDAAFDDGKFSAAAMAEVARGKVAGLYVERVEVDDVTDRAEQMRRRREERLATRSAG